MYDETRIPPPPPDIDINAATLPSIKIVKNDYNQHFVDTGERPQNFIRDHETNVRFLEYPKLARLIRCKDELNKARAHPPVHIKANLKSFDWSSLGTLFDVILIDPPWREYAEKAASLGIPTSEDTTPWTLQDMINYIKVEQISDVPSFCFLWCGTSHLDDGRTLLQTWGYRRCEDICWCKTNLSSSEKGIRRVEVTDERGLFQRTTEHCLMGVKGAVRRSTDTHFIHANIDTDVIVAEGPVDSQGVPTASSYKPPEIYEIIQRFCLGRRKIELFGLDRNIRPGWLTIGHEISVTNFDKERYISWFNEPFDSNKIRENQYEGGRYIGSTSDIDQLRPKSPSRSGPQTRSAGAL